MLRPSNYSQPACVRAVLQHVRLNMYGPPPRRPDFPYNPKSRRFQCTVCGADKHSTEGLLCEFFCHEWEHRSDQPFPIDPVGGEASSSTDPSSKAE